MPSEETCAKEWKKLGYSSASACRNYKKPAKTQKAGTSPKEELSRTRKGLASAHGGVTGPIKGMGKKLKKGLRRTPPKPY